MEKSIKKTILVVDDHGDDRIFLKQLFESQGYHVLLASNGEVAQEVLAEEIVNLVFSDVLMPVMDGLELCKIIKNSAELKYIPVILYTSIYSHEEDVECAVKSGADYYLIKPASTEMILEILGRVIGKTASKIEAGNDVNDHAPVQNKEQFLRLYSTKLVQKLEQEVGKINLEITKRKNAEQEQKEILNSMIDGVITIDEEGRILSFNLSAEELFGYKSKEVIGENIRILMPEPYSSQHSHYLQRYKETSEAHIINAKTGREVMGMNKNSDTFPMRLLIAKLPDDSSGKTRYIGACHDLTFVKQQEEELRRSQKMEALGKLTGGIAHDYNNMLSIVTGYAVLLEEALSEQPKLASYAHEIYHAGERGAKLTKKLLGFSRLKNPNKKKLNINELLYDEQHMLEKILTVRIQLILDLDNDLWPVNLDSADLEDAIINMCINSMYAIEKNGQITIQTRNKNLGSTHANVLNLNTNEDYVMLRISDTGCGINASEREKVFDPFYTTKGEEGTGLGLSQVFGFVQRSQGVIEVQSDLSVGTQFALYFPRCYAKKNEPIESSVTSDFKGTETILVVDDEPSLLKLATEILNARGYHVLCANNFQSAIEILDSESIDLLLSDVVMPDMDGYELAYIVKQKHPKVKIQLASGFTDKKYENIVDSELHKNLLTKPYAAQALLKKIRTLLDS